MSIVQFEDWPTHDGWLRSLQCSWESQSVTADMSLFVGSGSFPVPCVGTWRGVTRLHIPLLAPWGASSFINENQQIGQTYKIEMQSGDVIEIDAISATFSMLSAPNLEPLLSLPHIKIFLGIDGATCLRVEDTELFDWVDDHLTESGHLEFEHFTANHHSSPTVYFIRFPEQVTPNDLARALSTMDVAEVQRVFLLNNSESK